MRGARQRRVVLLGAGSGSSKHGQFFSVEYFLLFMIVFYLFCKLIYNNMPSCGVIVLISSSNYSFGN